MDTLTVSKAQITSAWRFSTENDSILFKMTVCLLLLEYLALVSALLNLASPENLTHNDTIAWKIVFNFFRCVGLAIRSRNCLT